MWSPDDTSICTIWNVTVEVYDVGVQLCLFVDTIVYDADDTIISSNTEQGGALLPDGAFTLDQQLRTATLAPVTVTVFALACDEFGGCIPTDTNPREITISGTWTGVSELMRSKQSYRTDEGRCKITYTTHSEERQATATLTIDGQVLETEYAYLNRSRTSDKQIGCA